MRESKLYLYFFRKNIFIILVPLVISLLGFYFYSQSQPKIYVLEQLYELEYTEDEVMQKTLVADEAVALIRRVKDIVLLDSGVEVGSYKPGPVSVILVLKSKGEKEGLVNSYGQVDKFITEKFEVKKIGGVRLNEEVLGQLVPLLIFSGVGFFAGLTGALVKEYLNRY